MWVNGFQYVWGGVRQKGGNVTTFRYLGMPLDQTDDDCMAVQRNAMRARLVSGKLGTLLQREGVESKVLGNFYRAVVQEIILYG